MKRDKRISKWEDRENDFYRALKKGFACWVVKVTIHFRNSLRAKRAILIKNSANLTLQINSGDFDFSSLCSFLKSNSPLFQVPRNHKNHKSDTTIFSKQTAVVWSSLLESLCLLESIYARVLPLVVRWSILGLFVTLFGSSTCTAEWGRREIGLKFSFFLYQHKTESPAEASSSVTAARGALSNH